METFELDRALIQPQNLVDSQFWDTIDRADKDLPHSQFGSILAPIVHDYNFRSALGEELTTLQQIAESTNGWVTPANVLDALGFGATMYGIKNLDSWKGVTLACAGMMTDLVDGPLARATGTQSKVGEAIDAGGDKIKLAYALYKIWVLDLAPKPLVTAIAIQNGLNIALTAADRHLNEEPVIHPSKLGKRTIFMEQWGLGLHVIGSLLETAHPTEARNVKRAGDVLGWAGVTTGVATTAGYTAVLWTSRRK